MTTSASAPSASRSPSNGESLSSLARWRQFLSGACNTARHLGATLNWRPVREIEAHTQRIENEILRVRSDSELIEKDIEQIKKETEQL
jgi:hypothetical protein